MTDTTTTTDHSMRGDAGILGTLGWADGRGVVRVQDRYDTAIDDLWSAVTDPERLARWIGVIEGELRVGGEFRARFATTGWEGTGRVEECEPPYRWLVRTWDAPDPDTADPGAAGSGAVNSNAADPGGAAPEDAGPEEHTIEATLTADGEWTVLVIEERGMPLDQLAAYGAGLHVHAEDLAAYLTGRERRETRESWAELLPAYQSLAAEVG